MKRRDGECRWAMYSDVNVAIRTKWGEISVGGNGLPPPFATPAELAQFTPYRGLHPRRERTGVVPRSRAISCRPRPIRNLVLAARRLVPACAAEAGGRCCISSAVRKCPPSPACCHCPAAPPPPPPPSASVHVGTVSLWVSVSACPRGAGATSRHRTCPSYSARASDRRRGACVRTQPLVQSIKHMRFTMVEWSKDGEQHRRRDGERLTCAPQRTAEGHTRNGRRTHSWLGRAASAASAPTGAAHAPHSTALSAASCVTEDEETS
jgi:hypothetical protein